MSHLNKMWLMAMVCCTRRSPTDQSFGTGVPYL